jgi:hypothetical protein
MIPSTAERVPSHTAADVNDRIHLQTEANVARYAALGPAEIGERLRELDREWDVERALEAHAALAVLAGLPLGTGVSRKLLVLPALVGAFLFQHAVQGWCPPLPVFRRLGFRTAQEIEHERVALKMLRGDFEALSADPRANDRAPVGRLLHAVER